MIKGNREILMCVREVKKIILKEIKGISMKGNAKGSKKDLND